MRGHDRKTPARRSDGNDAVRSDAASAAAALHASQGDGWDNSNAWLQAVRDGFNDAGPGSEWMVDNPHYKALCRGRKISAEVERLNDKVLRPDARQPFPAEDMLGYRIGETGSPRFRILAGVLDGDSDSTQVGAVVRIATDDLRYQQRTLHAMEQTHSSDPGYDQEQVDRTRINVFHLGQTLCAAAAHPNATSQAARQAMRAEGKYSGREVLRYSQDPELIQEALDSTDTGVWYAIRDDETVNPALNSGQLGQLIDAYRDPNLGSDPAHRDKVLDDILGHPSLTDTQRSDVERLIAS